MDRRFLCTSILITTQLRNFMIIKLDINEIPDEVYNKLLMEFVKKAIIEGVDVPRGAKVEDWNLTAELIIPTVH